MMIYPAIDIAGGKCVRLYKGIMSQSTVYFENPLDVAKLWSEAGAQWIHVVDLDGAFQGKLENLAVVKNIIETVDLKIQFGGGIRDIETAERLLSLGISRIVVGTKALSDKTMVANLAEKHRDKFAVALDVKGSKVATKGWVEDSDVNVLDLASDLKKLGIEHFIYTQILKDGTLEGPDLQGLKNLSKVVNNNVIASGGISSLDDVSRVMELEPEGVNGVIIGKALYEKAFKLKEVLELVGS